MYHHQQGDFTHTCKPQLQTKKILAQVEDLGSLIDNDGHITLEFLA